jgi:DNA-binding transcriptional ArsR family regulator
MRLSGYQIDMKKEAQRIKSLADETRLKRLWLLMGREELCVCDITLCAHRKKEGLAIFS